ncbi:MAG: MBOAT family protein [Lachnospiraceae bacterium]|nr:MBOAT family protein [Lachnospiraceae bacterium]
MVFSSFLFLCGFLPAVFVLHTAIRNTKARNVLLAVASLVFYACGEPVYIILLMASVTVNYVIGLSLGKKKSKAVLALAVVLNIGLLVVFKYTGLFTLPVGISFYTFQILSYVIDVYRGQVKAQKNYISLLLYISFFPQLIAGPIVKYHDVEMQIQERTVTAEEVKNGIFRFAAGLGKKVIIANGLAVAVDKLYALDPGTLGIGPAWFMITAYAFQLVFDFSAYSDMAIGLGKMFGFQFPENFNYPYISRSVREYWKRNHISLSTWFREYLYFPLGGSRRGEGRTVLNLLIVFLATGIWHGAGWTFPVWGLYQALFIILEREHIINSEKWPRVLATLYTDLTIWVGLVLFRADTFAQAWGVWKAMVGIGTTGNDAALIMAETVTPYRILLLILAAFLATPILRNGVRKWRESARKRGSIVLTDGLLMLGTLALILLCLLQLASDSYNPFIYYRF